MLLNRSSPDSIWLLKLIEIKSRLKFYLKRAVIKSSQNSSSYRRGCCLRSQYCDFSPFSDLFAVHGPVFYNEWHFYPISIAILLCLSFVKRERSGSFLTSNFWPFGYNTQEEIFQKFWVVKWLMSWYIFVKFWFFITHVAAQNNSLREFMFVASSVIESLMLMR